MSAVMWVNAWQTTPIVIYRSGGHGELNNVEGYTISPDHKIALSPHIYQVDLSPSPPPPPPHTHTHLSTHAGVHCGHDLTLRN